MTTVSHQVSTPQAVSRVVDLAPRPPRGRRDRADRLAANWFVLPVMIVFGILTVVPLGFSIFWSFTDYRGFSGDFSFVGFDNYVTIFGDPQLLGGLGFTLAFTVGTTVLITLLAIPLALLLNRKFFGRNLARSVFFFLGVPSLAILGLVWRYILSPLKSGVANQVLTSFGLDTLPWLADPFLAQLSVILVCVWASTGWHATLYLAYMQSIPADLYEQATVDGANGWQKFTSITLPHLVGAIGVSTFLLVTGGLKVFELPFTLTEGGPGYATNTITSAIIMKGVAQSDYGVGSALAVLFTIAVLVVILLQVYALRFTTRRYT